MRLSWIVAFAAPALLASCALSNPSPERTVPAPRDRVVEATVEVFERYRIPVEGADATFGLVQSEAFAIHDGWNGMALDEVVGCIPSDRREATSTSVTLRLYVRVPRSPIERRRTPDHQVPRVPRVSYATGTTSTLELGGDGILRRDGEEMDCRLTAEFTQELLDAIALQAGGPAEDVIAGDR